jgi:hypothetical protein
VGNQLLLASSRWLLAFPPFYSSTCLTKWTGWATPAWGKLPVPSWPEDLRWLALNSHFKEVWALISASFVGNLNLNISLNLVIHPAGAQVESKPSMHGTTRRPLPQTIRSDRSHDVREQRVIGIKDSKR